MPEPDLDALIARARLEASARTADASADAAVLALLAEADGSLPLAALLASGARREAVARVCTEPEDKRARPRARLGVVRDEPVVWLTSTGWQATGRASGREVTPTADSVAHAQAPARLAAFLAARRETLARSGVAMRVAYGGPVIRRFSDEVTSRAWTAVKTQADGEGAYGTLTGGWLPDALVVESWPVSDAGAALYAQSWGTRPTDLDDLAETTVAIEVEDSRKANDPARSKCVRSEAAIRIGVCRAVVWVVRSHEVARSLTALGVGDPARRPGQLLVPARLLGLGGDDVPPVGPTWWPLGVPPDEA